MDTTDGTYKNSVVFPSKIHFPKTSRRLPQVRNYFIHFNLNKSFFSIAWFFALRFFFISTDTRNRCTEMWHSSPTRNALFASASPEGGRRSTFLRSRRKLLEGLGMVPKKDATFISRPNNHWEKSQLFCNAGGESIFCRYVFFFLSVRHNSIMLFELALNVRMPSVPRCVCTV